MKILIRLPNWLGDVVMSTAFISAVNQLYPQASIDVIVKSELAGLTKLIPGLETVYPFSKQAFKGLGGAYRFGKKLSEKEYDVCFNLPASLSSLVLAWATGAKNRIGFGNRAGFFLLTKACKKPSHVHRVDEYISLLEQFTNKKIVDRRVKLNHDKEGKKEVDRVLINFNSEAISRRMPLDKAKRIVNLLIATFPNVMFTLIGSAKEVVFIDEIIRDISGPIENFAGKTDLVAMCNMAAHSAALLTTDSGPAHVANSTGTPVVVLFGAGNEHNTAPYNKQNLTVLRYGKLSCEPCLKNTCKLYGVPKCMELMDELEIVNALRLYLSHA